MLAACALAALVGWTHGVLLAGPRQQQVVIPGQGPAAQRGQPPPVTTGTGFMSGQVVESPSGKGIAGATVFLSGGRIGRQLVADSQGRFFFNNLPAQPFSVQAMQQGYAPLASVNQSRQVDLMDGDRVTDLKVRLVKFASVAGTVRDEVGDPVVGIDIRLFRRQLANGRRSLRAAGETKTDDRGAYRMAGLQPGDYVVCACRKDPIPFDGVLLATLASDPLQLMGVAARALTAGADVASIDSSLRTVAPAFHPSSPTFARASNIKLAPADEKTSIDIDVMTVRATRVSGTIAGATSPLDASQIRLTPAGESAEGATLATLPPMLVQPDGRFDFAGVPPGQYVLSVLAAPRPGTATGAPSGAALQFIGGRGAMAPGAGGGMAGFGGPPSGEPTLWASEPVTVGDNGVSGLSIALRRAPIVSGRVEFAGAAPQPTQRGVVFFQTVDPVGSTAYGQGSTVAVIGPDGAFQIPNVVPGRYSVVSNGAPRWPTLKSAVVAGVDVTDLPFTVDATDLAGVVITYSDTPMATLSGTLLGASDPSAPDLSVLVFPSDRKYWADPGASGRRFRSAPMSRRGAYNFASLPAGEYFIAVVSDEATVDWLDPTRFEALSRTAQRVQVVDGDKKILDVKR